MLELKVKEGLYSLEEVAELLNTSLITTRKYAKEGRFGKPEKIGKHTYIRGEELERFFKA